MEKVRIHEIAHELKISSKDIISMTKHLGLELKTASSSVSMEEAEKIVHFMMTGIKSETEGVQQMEKVMTGKVKFYSDAKGFGQIIGEDENEYFFHIKKVFNKPEKIFPNDKVEFIGFNTEKGLNARDVTFKAKVVCHACNCINTDDISNCQECGFTLKYAKNGMHVEISEEEVRQYKQKLKMAKKT